MKNLILSISTATIIILSYSCSTSVQEKNTIHNEHPHNENQIELTKQQQKALNLKLGTFKLKNLSNTININGEIKISPKNIAEITTIIGGNVKKIYTFNGQKVKKDKYLPN